MDGEDRARSLRWRLRVDGAASGEENMALDHALAHAVEAGTPGEAGILRLYRWAHPTVSLGRNQTARGLYDLERAEREGIDFVRRPSGGRAVLHDQELTYAVALPVDTFGGLRSSYHRINEALVTGLRLLGVPAALAGPGEHVLSPDAGPCFREPVAGEVVVEEVAGSGFRSSEGGVSVAVPRKIAGSAQLRLGRTILQHGALPLGGSQKPLEGLLRETPDFTTDGTGGGSGGTSLAGVLGRVTEWEEVADAIEQGFRRSFGGEWWPLEEDLPEPVLAERLRLHYASSGWTWRR